MSGEYLRVDKVKNDVTCRIYANYNDITYYYWYPSSTGQPYTPYALGTDVPNNYYGLSSKPIIRSSKGINYNYHNGCIYYNSRMLCFNYNSSKGYTGQQLVAYGKRIIEDTLDISGVQCVINTNEYNNQFVSCSYDNFAVYFGSVNTRIFVGNNDCLIMSTNYPTDGLTAVQCY